MDIQRLKEQAKGLKFDEICGQRDYGRLIIIERTLLGFTVKLHDYNKSTSSIRNIETSDFTHWYNTEAMLESAIEDILKPVEEKPKTKTESPEP